jgi:hypothetical protein
MNVRSAVAGAGVGAGLMFLLDPARGKRRRALLRDQAVHLAHETNAAVGVVSRDLPNRVRGLEERVRDRFSDREVCDDDVLAARVRSHLGRVVSHPHAIAVAASEGHVTLSGPILTAELGRAVDAVRGIRGVVAVDNRLEPHDTPDHVSALQGGIPRHGARFALYQEHWSPTARLLTGVAGGALAIYGYARHDLLGMVLGASGLSLGARAATNRGVKRLLGTAES